MFADRKCNRDEELTFIGGIEGKVAWNKWKETEPLSALL